MLRDGPPTFTLPRVADLFQVQKLFYTPDVGIPEESSLIGVILVDQHGSRVGFAYRELSATEAEEDDRIIVNATLEEIAEAGRNGALDAFHKTYLRSFSLSLALGPLRPLRARDRQEADRLIDAALERGARVVREPRVE